MFYDDVVLVVLLVDDLEELWWFVIDVLGDLSVDDECNSWLCEMLWEFLLCNCSYVVMVDVMILYCNII